MCGYAADYLTPEMSVGQGARPSILSVSRNLLTANAHQGMAFSRKRVSRSEQGKGILNMAFIPTATFRRVDKASAFE